MSTIESAACIIGEVGCYADLAIGNDGEFDILDRQNRIAAAAGELVDWVGESLPDSTDDGKLPFASKYVDRIARLVACAMEAQREFGTKAERGRAARLAISPAAAEVIKGLVDRLVVEGDAR